MSDRTSSDDGETAPLVPNSEDHAETSRSSTPRDADDIQNIRDPLHIRILYSLSLLLSLGGLGCTLWGYYIVRTAPFSPYARDQELASYETNFLGMQSILVFLGINSIWSGINVRLAVKNQQSHIWPLNMVYDFFIWALLIAFGVLNMVVALWDRRLCDESKDEVVYAKCDVEMFRLLVVELVAVNLGILVAVIHFILLVSRCCGVGTLENRSRALLLRRRIEEEEGLLVELMQRRRTLIEENEALEAAKNKPLPPIPRTVVEEPQEDLIDMVTGLHEAESASVERVIETAPSEDVIQNTGEVTNVAK